jgi:cobalt-zinc-cadmium efflux system protein
MAWALGLAATYMIVEIIGGFLSHSLALLADAGHMATDVAALGLALWAMRLATKPATPRRTYGYYRAEILAALANGIVLVAISLFLLLEAVRRFREPTDVVGGAMLTVAVGGLLVNGLAAWLLGGGRHESLNVRAAWLHVLADALGSIGVILGATSFSFSGGCGPIRRPLA